MHFTELDWVTAQGERLDMLALNKDRFGIMFDQLQGLGRPDYDVVRYDAAYGRGSVFEQADAQERIIEGLLTVRACDDCEAAELRRQLGYYFAANQDGNLCVADSKPRFEFTYCMDQAAVFAPEQDPKVYVTDWCGCMPSTTTTAPEPLIYTDVADFMRVNRYGWHGDACLPFLTPGGLIDTCDTCGKLVTLCKHGLSLGCGIGGLHCCPDRGVDKIMVRRSIDVDMLLSGLRYPQPAEELRIGAWDIVEKLEFLAGDPLFYDTDATTQAVLPGAQGDFQTETKLLYMGDHPTAANIVWQGPVNTPVLKHLRSGNVLTLDYNIRTGERVTVDPTAGTIISEYEGECTPLPLNCLQADFGGQQNAKLMLTPSRPLNGWRDANPIKWSGSGATIDTAMWISFRNWWHHL